MVGHRHEDDYDGFTTVERSSGTTNGGRGSSTVTDLVLAEPPWDRPSRSLESLAVVEHEEQLSPMSSVYARRNELLYQLSITSKPDVRRSIEARLALEEETMAEKFRADTHEPAKKKTEQLLDESDELIGLLQNL